MAPLEVCALESCSWASAGGAPHPEGTVLPGVVTAPGVQGLVWIGSPQGEASARTPVRGTGGPESWLPFLRSLNSGEAFGRTQTTLGFFQCRCFPRLWVVVHAPWVHAEAWK